MPNTYTQIFIQLIFAVKGRESDVRPEFKTELEKYITSVVQNDKNKLLAINCMPDHCHLLIGLHPDVAVSDMVLDIKRASTDFIKDKRFVRNDFHWQKGFGAFSYSKSAIPDVINYIINQEEHHRKITFKEEYLKFLSKFGIAYDEKYLFEFNE